MSKDFSYFRDIDKNPVFTCPNCFEYHSHTWKFVHGPLGETPRISFKDTPKLHPFNDELLGIIKSNCNHCNKFTFWLKSRRSDELQVYPSNFANYPQPHKDMPKHIKKTYIEAGSVLNISLGSSAALSRLTLENLLTHLGYKERNLNDKIGSFVSEQGQQGLNQKILDVIRVYGNSGAHTGIINLDEKSDVPITLLKLINIIIEQTITLPNEVDELYDLLSPGTKEAIEKRDATDKK